MPYKLEPELDARPDDMEDEIYEFGPDGKLKRVDVPDDTEDAEEPNYAEYD